MSDTGEGADRVTVVAEAAQGFEGFARQAQLLVRAGAQGGADLVKLQLVYADELAVPSYRWYDLFRELEMSDEEWRGVADEAERCGIGLAFDVYGPRSLDGAVALGARAVKVHSTDFFNGELVDAVLATGLDMWFSIGGITLDEVAEFLDRHAPTRPDQLTLMYGFQAEPTAAADNNLRRLATIRERFPDVRLGFMDHAAGDSDDAGWLGVLALPYGVRVIEKHITLGRALKIEDDVSALDAADFSDYVGRIRTAEAALGVAGGWTTDAETAYRNRALKVVVARRDLAAGEVVSAADVMLKRTALADGARVVFRLDRAVGRELTAPVAAHEAVTAERLREPA